MTVDLHLHTHYSDGTWSPADLVEHAVGLGLRQIAITDHDTVDGIKIGMQVARERLEIIPGIEFNTMLRSSGGEAQDVHILGYFIDTNSRELKDAIVRQQKARFEQAETAVAKLQAAGIAITMAQVQEIAGHGSIGKPHLTKAIVAAGGASNILEAYEKFTAKHSPFYVERFSISPQEAVRAIVSAGGIASLAHAGKDKNVFALLEALQQVGLQAVEVYHRMHSRQVMKRLLAYAKRRDLAVTGGSDCHGPYEEHPPTVGKVFVPEAVMVALKERLLKMRMT